MNFRYSIGVIGATILVLGFATTFQTRGDALSNWTWRNPVPQSSHLNAVVHGNGITVAVGNAGTIITSVDSTNWITRRTGGLDLVSIAHGNGRFVAVAGIDPFPTFFTLFPPGNAFSLVSTNGTNWSSPISIGPGPARVTFGNGRFVALLVESSFVTPYVSTNGLNWTAGTKTNMATVLRGLAFGNGRFVGIGSGSIGGTALVSTNGTNWSVTTITNRLMDIYFDDGMFYGAGIGGTFRSSDGVNWTFNSGDLAGPFSLTAIARGGNRFVADGSQLPRSVYGQLSELISTDGVLWTTNAFSGNGLTRDLCWTGQRFVAVGDGGRVSTSADGVTWSHNGSLPLFGLRDIAYGQGTLVAVGGGGGSQPFSAPWFAGRAVSVSSNGVHWTARIQTNAPGLWSVAYGSGFFLAVGNAGTVLRSTNAVAWDEFNAGVSNALFSVIFAGEKFVAVGSGGIILTSTDGTNWLTRASGISNALTGVTYGGGLYVAVGSNGSITTSPDGESWTPRSSGVNDSLIAVTWGYGRFVAVGNTRLWSADGVNWTAVPFGSSFASQVRVMAVNGVFLSIGVSSIGYVSADGANWEARTIPSIPFPGGFFGMMEYNGTMLLAGDFGSIVQSANFGAVLSGLKKANGFELAMTGELGRAYRLQATSNFLNWSDLYAFTSSQATNFFLDTSAPNVPLRFYRTVSP